MPKCSDLADVYFESKTSGIVEIKYTKIEIEVNRLARINPEIINLVRTFDLLDGDNDAIINID